MSTVFEEKYELIVQRDVATGAVLAHCWRMNGEQHNTTGPDLIRFDPQTGNPILKSWILHGRLSRLEVEGPAIAHYDPITGLETQAGYFLDGQHHRINGPAYIVRDPITRQVIKEEYYRFDKPYTPPAVSVAPMPSP